MATATLATFDNGNIRFEVDYDTSNRLTAFRCINGSNHTAYGKISQDSTGRTAEHTFAANSTTQISIPTGTSNRLLVGWDPARPTRMTGVTMLFLG